MLFAFVAAVYLSVDTAKDAELQNDFRRRAIASELALLAPVLETEVLLLDELGAQKPSDWVRELKRLLADAALRQRLAHAGRYLVEQQYDWSAIRADMRAAYQWLDG